jgi:NTP pyrophosphatase (non-canonical NTP hydrolase)
MSDNTFYSEYVRDMFKTYPDDEDFYVQNFGILHAVVGLSGEAGEVLDVVKKVLFTGKKYNQDDLVKELGDVEFYLQAVRNAIRVSRDDILNANVEKLSKRHPDGFSKSDYYKDIHG